MIKIALSLVLIPVAFAVLALLPLPDIPQAALDFITTAFHYAWIANKYFPIDTLFTLGSYALIIEFAIFTFHTVDKIRSAITGHGTLIKNESKDND